jgi:4-oxalocrotonate tautomerase
MPFIEVTLIEGRDKAKKLELMKRLTDAVVDSIGAPRESVRVVLREIPAEHWAVGGIPKG